MYKKHSRLFTERSFYKTSNEIKNKILTKINREKTAFLGLDFSTAPSL